MTTDLFGQTRRSAKFSPDRLHRYELRIVWDDSLPPYVSGMLNPSTADEVRNDPTIERNERRARRLGYGSLIVWNLGAGRAPFRSYVEEVMMDPRIRSEYGFDPSPRIGADGQKSWPEPDDLVTFTGENGTDADQAIGRRWLAVGDIYTVAEVRVGGWETRVRLDGISQWFNSVMFKVVPHD